MNITQLANRYFFIQKFHDLQYTPIYSKQTVLERTSMTTETTRYVSWMIIISIAINYSHCQIKTRKGVFECLAQVALKLFTQRVKF